MSGTEPRFDVTIAGEINLDLILYGLAEAMPLEREILASDFRLTLGGSSSILAHNLSMLGAKVGFCTRVGKDELAKIALDRLRESGCDLSRVICSEDATTTGVTILLHHGSRRHILTYPGTMSTMSRSDLDFDYLASARHFHLSSLFLQRALAPDLPALFRQLRHAGLTVSLDTNDDPEDLWGGVLDELLDEIDVFLPNQDEICRMTKHGNVEDALNSLSGRVPCIAVKCGSRGALVRTGNQVFHVPPVTVHPIDTIGAGDSFDAGFLYAYLQGLDPVQCATAGNVTGALSTLSYGGTEAFRDPVLRRTFLGENGFPQNEN